MTYIYSYQKNNASLSMQVKSPDGKTVWKQSYPAFVEDRVTGDLIEDDSIINAGIIKDCEDVAGIETLLKNNNIIGPDCRVEKR